MLKYFKYSILIPIIALSYYVGYDDGKQSQILVSEKAYNAVLKSSIAVDLSHETLRRQRQYSKLLEDQINERRHRFNCKSENLPIIAYLQSGGTSGTGFGDYKGVVEEFGASGSCGVYGNEEDGLIDTNY